MGSDRHIEAAKRRLLHLSGLAVETEAAERRILAAAEHRLGVVAGDLETLRPRVHVDADAASRYQELTQERGQLETVIARSRQVLGG